MKYSNNCILFSLTNENLENIRMENISINKQEPL